MYIHTHTILDPRVTASVDSRAVILQTNLDRKRMQPQQHKSAGRKVTATTRSVNLFRISYFLFCVRIGFRISYSYFISYFVLLFFVFLILIVLHTGVQGLKKTKQNTWSLLSGLFQSKETQKRVN